MRKSFLTRRAFLMVGLLAPTLAQVLAAAPAHGDEVARQLKCDVTLDANTKIAAQAGTLRFSKGRSLFVQVIKASKPGMPTLLMMPGVNRNLLLEEQAGQTLAQQGFGLITFSFSTQPFSVNALPSGERPSFLSESPELQDLAQEAAAVVKNMGGGNVNVVPVSLSYSGAVSPLLKGFSTIVETVPMTATAATNPQLETFRQNLIAGQALNPFGAAVIRSTMDFFYQQHWSTQVDQIAQQFNLAADRKSDMVQGYVAMSRATEGFEWDLAKLPKETRRIFVIAGNDSPSLQKSQIATFQQLSKQRKDALMFVVLESGHVIPAEQPAAYACALKLALLNKDLANGVVVIEPSTGKVTLSTGSQADAVLSQLKSSAEKNESAAGNGISG